MTAANALKRMREQPQYTSADTQHLEQDSYFKMSLERKNIF